MLTEGSGVGSVCVCEPVQGDLPWAQRPGKTGGGEGMKHRELQGWAPAPAVPEGSGKPGFVKPSGRTVCQKRVKGQVGVFRVTDGYVNL